MKRRFFRPVDAQFDVFAPMRADPDALFVSNILTEILVGIPRLDNFTAHGNSRSNVKLSNAAGEAVKDKDIAVGAAEHLQIGAHFSPRGLRLVDFIRQHRRQITPKSKLTQTVMPSTAKRRFT